MLDRLPEYIDPIALAEKRAALAGQIAVSDLERLTESLFSNEGAIFIELEFGKEDKVFKITGKITADLKLKCQNCLESLDWPIDLAVKLCVISKMDEADKLPADFEPLLFDVEKLSLKSLVEDEILLDIPSFPKHEHDCLSPLLEQNADGKSGTVASETKQAKPNPFSVLSKLKNSGEL